MKAKLKRYEFIEFTIKNDKKDFNYGELFGEEILKNEETPNNKKRH